MVVLYHYTGSFLPAIQPGHFTGLIEKSYLMVDFFFILSGFIMSHVYARTFHQRVSWQDFRSFVGARLARIYPLHLVILVSLVVLELTMLVFRDLHWGVEVQRPFGHLMSFWGLFLNFFLLQTTGLQRSMSWNGPAWSIGAEFFAYLIFPMACFIVLRMRHRHRLLAMLALAVGLFLISHDGTDLDRTNSFGLFRCLLEFGLGVLIYQYFPMIRLPRPLSDLFSVGVIAAILIAMHLRAQDILMPGAFALLVLLLASNQGRVARALSVSPLLWLGRTSYSIYMSHFLVLRAVEFVSMAASGSRIGTNLTLLPSLLVLAMMVGLVLALSAYLHAHVERPAREAVRNGLASFRLTGAGRGDGPRGGQAGAASPAGRHEGWGTG